MEVHKFEVGSVTTAQLGDIIGSPDYRENAEVTILAIRKNVLDHEIYLIKIDEGHIGVATKATPRSNIKGKLYCNVSRLFGETKKFKDLESAAWSLWFRL